MIELTGENFEKFWLNSTLVKTIIPLRGNMSQINLTTGGYVVCIEPNDKVAKKITDLSKEKK
jgi:uncharacterized protein YlzI (FlbEa/FlbD family)